MRRREGNVVSYLTDAQFVQRTIEARQANDKVWLAYALGTLESVDTIWTELEQALRGLTIDDLLA
jgi:hypothetical protein